MKFILELWPDIEDRSPEAALAFAVDAIKNNGDLQWDVVDDTGVTITTGLQLQRKYRVRYAVRTGIDGSTLGEGTHTVWANDRAHARDLTADWVHDHDELADPRVDPAVVVLDAVEIDYTEEG